MVQIQAAELGMGRWGWGLGSGLSAGSDFNPLPGLANGKNVPIYKKKILLSHEIVSVCIGGLSKLRDWWEWLQQTIHGISQSLDVKKIAT